MSEWTSKEAEESFGNILDTFTGADGGIKFLLFMTAMKDFDKRAGGDPASGKIVDIMLNFSRLIDVTTTTKPQ